MKGIITLLIIILFNACYVQPVTYYNTDDIVVPIDLKGFKGYTIKKGEHTSGTHIDVTYNDNIEAYVQLSESMHYRLQDTVDQWDVNKIIGLSDAIHHHTASIRLGWRSIQNRIDLVAYVRQEGIHRTYPLIEMENAKGVIYTKIIIYPMYYKITVMDINDKGNTNTLQIKRNKPYTGIRYKLYPYFGGLSKAPHDIQINIKEI